jgi:hypothetical protein
MTCFAAKALSDLGLCQFIGFSVIIVVKADFKGPFFGSPKKATNDLSLITYSTAVTFHPMKISQNQKHPI